MRSLIRDANLFQLQTMRCRPRNLQARRRKWPLRLGLFLIYVLVQYVSSTPSTETTTSMLSSSAQWTPESSVSTTEEEATEKVSTEEPKKASNAEGSKTETPPKGHGRAETGTQNQFRENARNRETPKITETPPPRQGRNDTITVSGLLIMASAK